MNDNEKSLKGPQLLQHFEDNWETEMGAFFPSEGRVVLRGKDLLNEFKDHGWVELMVFAVTGRESKKIARLLEASWVLGTSFPDPRLWNNRVAALGGSVRTTAALAINAASAVSEANAFGARVGTRAGDVLHRFKKAIDEGDKLENLIKKELKKYKLVSGFGRPLVSKDERVGPLMDFAKSIGCGNGPFVKLAFDISSYFENSRYPFRINVAAVISALLADEGLSPEQAYYLGTQCFVGGIVPCYIDAINHTEGTLFPLSTDRIEYRGEYSERSWNTLEI